MMNLKRMVRGLEADAAAREAVRLWEHDSGTLAFWRASTNFVYGIKNRGETYFLRFSHEEDNDAGQIEAELEFMQHLRNDGYAAVKPVASNRGELIEQVPTAHGIYYAVAFEEAKGIRLDRCKLAAADYGRWGVSLASLHRSSMTFEPKGAGRGSWKDAMAFISSVLRQHPNETDAIAEWVRLNDRLEKLPQTPGQYGHIHYDFERDNVFLDEATGEFTAIDFDDAMVHWFAMDVVSTLRDIADSGQEEADSAAEAFLEGYRSVKELEEGQLALAPYFERFSGLYGFARVLHALEDSDGVPDAPPWYEGLRTKLLRSLEKDREGFRRRATQ
ncbi:phosphotransferase enzyme family protein [Paenibacillus sp. MBLB4367]|uniref:phosphotransferase enzyme family protein n=1 Tax=Paenibacillus sp. MBLB4367 TaxID=3384767 RepID=UPI003907ED3D